MRESHQNNKINQIQKIKQNNSKYQKKRKNKSKLEI
jgi:hypothetical protein